MLICKCFDSLSPRWQVHFIKIRLTWTTKPFQIGNWALVSPELWVLSFKYFFLTILSRCYNWIISLLIVFESWRRSACHCFFGKSFPIDSLSTIGSLSSTAELWKIVETKVKLRFWCFMQTFVLPEIILANTRGVHLDLGWLNKSLSIADSSQLWFLSHGRMFLYIFTWSGRLVSVNWVLIESSTLTYCGPWTFLLDLFSWYIQVIVTNARSFL